MNALRNWTWKNLSFDQHIQESLGLEFELNLYTSSLEHNPDDVSVLLEVGNLYTRLGRFQEGLAIDEKLVKIKPEEPVFHYNLACSLALLEAIEPAFVALKTAVQLGYNNLEHLQKDKDLKMLRQDPRFSDILKLLIHTHRERVGRKSEEEILEQELDFQD